MNAAEGQAVARMTVRTVQVGLRILKYYCLSVVFASSLSGQKNMVGKK